MNGLTAYLHARGLKAGIYISPGPLTCAHYEGSLGHEAQDLNTFVKWGFDFLKYDWCTYGKATPGERTPEYYKKPYRLMGDLVKKAPRDIVFNLCQYGMGDVWTWGREVGGNFWRTTGDLGLGSNFKDFWAAVDKIGFGQLGKEKYAGPGGWNDPDNILIGHVLVNNELAPVPLTLDEKRSYFTLWAMLAAPLVLGSDMTKLDAETLAVLTNDDVIDINQDGLGLQAVMTAQEGSVQTWTKKLEGGAEAVAIFNRGTQPKRLRYDFTGVRELTDLWRKVNYGIRNSFFEVTVPPHAVLLMRSTPK
jgi:alpha-galactosidase